MGALAQSHIKCTNHVWWKGIGIIIIVIYVSNITVIYIVY
jgi:hypothetical protein